MNTLIFNALPSLFAIACLMLVVDGNVREFRSPKLFWASIVAALLNAIVFGMNIGLILIRYLEP